MMTLTERRLPLQDEPCVGLILGTRPVLLLTDVDLIRTVMSRDFQHFMDRGLPYDRHGEPLTANLFNLRASALAGRVITTV